MKARRAGGFTLIEVLVALAIVAVALGAGIRAAGALADNAGRLAEVSAAEWCADNQLNALRLAHQYPGVGDVEFSCDELGLTYRGVLRTQATYTPTFRRVDAVVSDAAGRPLLSLTALFARY